MGLRVFPGTSLGGVFTSSQSYDGSDESQLKRWQALLSAALQTHDRRRAEKSLFVAN
jgi:hypothetical protein